VEPDNARNAAIVYVANPDGTVSVERIFQDGAEAAIPGSFNFLTAGGAADTNFAYGCGGAGTCRSIPLP
jgi:ferredoxin